MPSRQDQLHSYQFMVQRVVGALVMRETDPAQSPFRRAAGATLASVLIALIAVGGSVVVGLFLGGGATKWKDASVVIVEKESGAQYVYYENKLHPVLNYASALLIIKGAGPKTVSVSRKSLEGEPRGEVLGIRDLPESLPPTNRLIGGGWTICSEPRAGTGDQAPQSTLLIGEEPPGGRPLGDEGLLAVHPNGELYLIWQNRRHQIRDETLVIDAMALGGVRQVQVAPALLNALPAGADLARIDIADAGEPSEAVEDAKIGEVFLVDREGGGGPYAVAKRDGLYNITQLQAYLLLTADLAKQGRATPMSQGDYGALPKKGNLVPAGDGAAPATAPKMATAEGGVVCGGVPDDRGVNDIKVGADMSKIADPPPTTARSAQGGVLADQVILKAGNGVVVEAAAAAGATGGAISVVTDQGRRHPVTSGEVLGNLGYGSAKRVRMPAALVSFIPQGPALDPDKARLAAAPG